MIYNIPDIINDKELRDQLLNGAIVRKFGISIHDECIDDVELEYNILDNRLKTILRCDHFDGICDNDLNNLIDNLIDGITNVL